MTEDTTLSDVLSHYEFVPEKENMTVISFHTCEESELEEIACETGGERLYEGKDT